MNMNEQNFIQQLKEKNEKALMYVIDEYGGLIYTVIKKNMSCLIEYQEECFNDVLLSVWDNISYFNPEKNSFKNWIAAIAKYKSIDYLRKYKKLYSELSYDNDSIEEHSGEEDFEAVLEGEISQRTKELLDCLPLKDRDIFIDLYVKEETLDEISMKYEIKKNVLYNRISRAKKKIRMVKGANIYG